MWQTSQQTDFSYFRKLFATFILAGFSALFAQHIEIGYADIINTGLPIEPMARYSYSQQILYPGDIAYNGQITKISFHYQISSQNFLEANKDWRIFIGHCTQNIITDWIDVSAMSQVFNGSLQEEWFLGGMTGNGWLQIPLDNSFFYNGNSNLLIAVSEHNSSIGNNSDDFLSWPVTNNRARKYVSMSDNPDPYNPPSTGSAVNALNHLRLHFSDDVSTRIPQALYGYAQGESNKLFWKAPSGDAPQYYTINRNGQNIGSSTDCDFEDLEVLPDTNYLYSVQAFYTHEGLSPASPPYLIHTPEKGISCILFESFEDYSPFCIDLDPYLNLDLDGAANWGFADIDFPHEGEALGWMVFSPEDCTPPLAMPSYVSGEQFLMSLSSTQPPNNDWLISPVFSFKDQGKLSFFAGRLSNAYGAERIRVLISNTGSSPQDFVPLHSASYLLVENSWQEFEFDISPYSNQEIRFALNCCSLDALALYVDHIQIFGKSKEVSIEDETLAPLRPYPNPARDYFTMEHKDYFELGIYNLRGQRIYKERGIKRFDSRSLKLSPGIYFLKVTSQEQSQVFRQVIVPR